MTSTDRNTELLILGAGPGGYPAAFHAADLGMKVTLVDPEPNPGGVCLYRGCIPSKALLHVASFLHEVEQAPEWGIKLTKPKIEAGKLNQWKNGVVQHLTGGLGSLTKQRGIRYLQGKARLKNPNEAAITSAEGKTTNLSFDHAIVATGSVPASLPDLPESSRIMTSTEALDVSDIPATLLVVGGGYIGIELGQIYAALGTRVTLVEMLPEILPGVDRDLVKILERRLNKQFTAIHTKTKISGMSVTKKGIQATLEGQSDDQADFEKVLIATGRKPCTADIGLDDAGVEIGEDGFITVDDRRGTSRKTIYAVGDVAGEPMLAHKATHEARVAVEAIAGKKTVFEPNAIPFVVFSDPEIAWCGLSETNARQQGINIRSTSFPWKASGRAVTLSRSDGLTKMICHAETGRILGLGMAGHGAGELLAEGVLAMELGAVADDLAWTVHAHPTLSETLMEAAQAISGQSTHWKQKGTS